MAKLVHEVFLKLSHPERCGGDYYPVPDYAAVRAVVEVAGPIIAEKVKEQCAEFVETHTLGRRPTDNGLKRTTRPSSSRVVIAQALRDLDVMGTYSSERVYDGAQPVSVQEADHQRPATDDAFDRMEGDRNLNVTEGT